MLTYKLQIRYIKNPNETWKRRFHNRSTYYTIIQSNLEFSTCACAKSLLIISSANYSNGFRMVLINLRIFFTLALF